MPDTLASSSFKSPSRPHRHFAYLTVGPQDGPLMVFIHGWPDMALTWRPQMLCFAALGFRCVAMDTLGYGGSACPNDDAEYSLENLSKDQVEFLDHLGADKALWVAHDWGCGILWTVVSHHPEKCVGVIALGIPYRWIEAGLETELANVDRDVYPEDQYPNGQFDYQVWYEQKRHEGTTKQFDGLVDKVLKLIYARGNPDVVGKPGATSGITKAGGWFGGIPDEKVPDIPLSMTGWEGNEDIYEAMVTAMKKNGFHGATSYYLNHKLNAEYNKWENIKNNGVVEMPVLLVDAKYDGVCAEWANKPSYQKTRELCRNLTQECIEAAHWARLEKWRETNNVMAKWLVEKMPEYWPKIKATL
jgi:soluble epoxide hydrolase / lipid-phosphate phosphatase